MRVYVVPALPPRAWLAKLGRTATLVCGVDVNVDDDFFAEGTWVGDKTARGLSSAPVSTATGASFTAAGTLFSTRTDTLSRAYLARVQNALLVSNSFPFLLAFSGHRIDPSYSFYHEDLSSIVNGLHNYVRKIRMATGHIMIFYHGNILVDHERNIVFVEKTECPPFRSFRQYETFLLECLRDLCSGHERVISTISSGYDSAACSALARSIGCRSTMTFVDPDNPGNDNGEAIARHLGLECEVMNRSEYKKTADFHEFLCLGTRGEDIYLSSSAHRLQNSILVTGFLGGNVWGLHDNYVSRDIIRGDPSGIDVEEFRLRVSFTHVAVPFIAARRNPEIFAISRSDEMKPWRLGTSYDRPIPRRILESRGVPRDTFGHVKRVASRSFGGGTDLSWYLSASAFQDYTQYYSALSAPSRREQVMHYLYRTFTRLEDYAYRPSHFFSTMLSRHREPLNERYLFAWAMQEMVRRYRSTLAQTDAVGEMVRETPS